MDYANAVYFDPDESYGENEILKFPFAKLDEVLEFLEESAQATGENDEYLPCAKEGEEENGICLQTVAPWRIAVPQLKVCFRPGEFWCDEDDEEPVLVYALYDENVTAPAAYKAVCGDFALESTLEMAADKAGYTEDISDVMCFVDLGEF